MTPLAIAKRGQLALALSRPWVIACIAFLWFSIGAWRGLTVDEYTTWNNTKKPLADLITNRLRAGHLPTFFALERFWVSLAGESEFALRFPSLALASIAVAFAFAFVRHRFSPSIACVSTLLLATNQVTVWCAQNARPYAGVLFSLALTAWALDRFFSSGRLRALLLVSVSVILGISFYAATALSMVTFAAICAVHYRNDFRRALAATLSLLVPLLFMLLPVFLLAQKQEKFEDFAGPLVEFDVRRPFNLLARTVFGDYRLWARGFLRWPLLLAFFTLALNAWLWLGREQANTRAHGFWLRRSGIFLWVFLPLVGLAIAEAITQANVLSHPRYLVHCLMPIAIIEALGLNYCGSKACTTNVQKKCLFGATIVLNLISTAAWLFTNGDGPRVVAARMLREPTKAVGVLGTTLPLEYEWRAVSHPPLIPQYSPNPTAIENIGAQGPFFVFVYNNKPTAWDEWISTATRGRYKLVKHYQWRDTRVFLLSPSSIRRE